jgi:predicted Zn-dependent protease
MEENRLEMLKKMLESDPGDAFLRYALAKEYEKLNDDNQAIRLLEALKTDEPEYTGLYYHLGKLYEKVNQADEALSTYNEGIHITKALGDLHALSELNNAKTNLELGC